MPTFTHDMLNCFPTGAQEAFGHFGERPINYLEIGTFEGMSADWMFRNILKHRASRYVGVEVDEVRCQTTRQNLSEYKDRSLVLCGDSSIVLMNLLGLGVRFDAIYVDGDHREEEAHTDAVLSWNLLNPRGVILFDDYTLEWSSIDPSVSFGVMRAVSRLLYGVSDLGHHNLAANGYQYIVRKT